MGRILSNLEDTFSKPPRINAKAFEEVEELEIQDIGNENTLEDDLDEYLDEGVDEPVQKQTQQEDTSKEDAANEENQEAFAELFTDAYNLGQVYVWTSAYGMVFNERLAKDRKAELDAVVTDGQVLSQAQRDEFKALNKFFAEYHTHRSEYGEKIMLQGVIKNLFQRYLTQAFKAQNINFDNPWKGLIMIILLHSIINAGLLAMSTMKHKPFQS